MRTTTAIAALLAASAGVSAASSAHPVLAFTSQQASSIHLELPTDSSLTGLIDSLYAAGRASPACQLDAIALVQAEHLDRDTFASLRHSSTDSLRARSLDAPSQVTFNAAPAEDAFGYLNSAKKVCGYKSYQLLNSSGLGQFSADATATGKPVFAEFQAGDIRQQESLLLETLDSLDEIAPRNLVIITQKEQWQHHVKRQFVAAPSSSSGNWTEPEGGIFARYQLFSTPLILTLILVGGVLLPIVYFAVSQLAQVQTPDQMGVRKDPISGDKKTQ